MFFFLFYVSQDRLTLTASPKIMCESWSFLTCNNRWNRKSANMWTWAQHTQVDNNIHPSVKLNIQTYTKPSSLIGRSISIVYCKRKKVSWLHDPLIKWIFVIPCETHRFLGTGLEGAYVVDPVLSDDGLRDYTLDVEVQDLDCDKVVIGDAEQVLLREKRVTH